MKAIVSSRVGGLNVHKRPASAILVEPKQLWPGYHVEIIGPDYQGRQKLWANIRYLYLNECREGWVIKEALDIERLPEPPLDPLKAPLPIPDVHPSFPWRALVAVAIGIALLAAAAFAL